MDPFHLLHYDPDDGLGDGGDGGAPEPVDAALPADGEPATPAEPAEPWSLSQEDWDATQGRLGVLDQLEQHLPVLGQLGELMSQGDPTGEDGAGEFDPFDPDSMSSYLEARDERLVNTLLERLNPVLGYVQGQQVNEGNERAMDIIRDMETREGEFLYRSESENELDSPTLAHQLAGSFYQEAQARYGPGPRAAEAAIERAYKQVRALEQSIGKAYHEREVNRLQTIGDAPREPMMTTAAGQPLTIPEGGDELSIASRHFRGQS